MISIADCEAASNLEVGVRLQITTTFARSDISLMEEIISEIYDFLPVDQIKSSLLRVPSHIFGQRDRHGFDLLHHAILANYTEVVRLLLLQGHWQQPDGEAGLCMYHHLACALGYAHILIVLQQFRGTQIPLNIYANRQKMIDCMTSVQRCRQCRPKIEDCDGHGESDPSENLVFKISTLDRDEIRPLDIAAHFGHVKCVEALLNCGHIQWSSASVLERSVECNSNSALKLLLRSQQHAIDAIDDAFKAALRRKLPCCIDTLLKNGARPFKVLNGLNPFHVMYVYSSAYQIHGRLMRNKGLTESTRMLLSHGYNICVKDPAGSYPLYSLLHSLIHEKDHNPTEVPVHHLHTLEVLLQAGANVNFDEVAMFGNNTNEKFGTFSAFGRELFTSGLNALFVSLQASDTWKPHVAQHMDDCCSKLLKHGADPNYVDGYGETPLHELMKLWAMQHAMGHVHADLSSMYQMMLWHGADPNLTSTNGLYSLEYYFTILFNLMGGVFAYRRWNDSGASQKVLQFLYLMDLKDAVLVGEQILKLCEQAKQDGMPDSVVDHLKEQIVYFANRPKPLQLLCQLQVWRAIGRKQAKLHRLPLPTKIMASIGHHCNMPNTS